jgi:hypothetical protein
MFYIDKLDDIRYYGVYRPILLILTGSAYMGKKTLYHPVSVNVIRGQLEFHGITPGRLHQTWASFEKARATYRLQLDEMPKELWGKGVDAIADYVQGCFSSDVTVHRVWITLVRTHQADRSIWILIGTQAFQEPHSSATEVNNG